MILVAWVALGCQPEVPGPNLLLISIDTARQDHFSAYGYHRNTSPNLQRLAESGIRLDDAYAPTATTGPSHASLFTGLHPRRTGVIKNGHVLSARFQTLAERFTEAGYASAGIISSFVLAERFGFGRGFETWNEDFSESLSPSGVTLWEGRRVEGKFYGSAEDTTRRAVGWLENERDRSKPFFLFVHYYDPHDPWAPPKDFGSGFAGELAPETRLGEQILRYDLEVAYTDSHIGQLVKAFSDLRLLDDTLIVVTGDHGEGLGRHGHLHHGIHIYDEAVRVPLIFYWPGKFEIGRRISVPLGLGDLGPTLLELLGVESDLGLGRSFAPMLLGEAEPDEDRPVHLYRRPYKGGKVGDLYAEGEKYGLRRGSLKLIVGPEEGTIELFDVVADPRELTNLVDERPEALAELMAELDAHRATLPSRATLEADLTEADRARLRALGYAE